MRSDYLGSTKTGVDVAEHLRGIDVLAQRGLILLDGHHLFLHSLRIAHHGIATWNQHAKEEDHAKPNRVLSGLRCPFEPVTPRLLSYVAGQLMHRSIDLATEAAALSLVPDGKNLVSSDFSGFIDPDWIVQNVDPNAYVVLDNDWDVIACDARLPSKKYYEQQLLRRSAQCSASSRYLEWEIQNIKRGQIRYWVGDRPFTEKYELKNDYLSDLQKNYFVSTREGVKKLQFAKSHNPWFKEKQVDVLLTIAMCDAALDKRLDWVCVVTNDSDYVPAIERMKSAGKNVIWLCADDISRRSADLLEVIGDDCSFTVLDLFGRRSDGSSKMFLKLFELPGRFRAQEKRLPDAEEGGSFTMAPWDKSYWEYQDELDTEFEESLHDST